MDRHDIGLQLHDYASGELARAIACLAWRGSRLHAGVHQARKSLRRTRATLALGAMLLGPGARLIDRELRQVNRGLSKLRDAHALAGVLDHLLARHVDDAQALLLLHRARRAAMRARAARARKSLARDPQLRGRRALLATLLAALHALPWHLLDADAADAALLRSRMRADAASAEASGSGNADDWHHWRRRARRLSQQQRALGNPVAADKHDKQLAVLLGQVQDHALLCEHCGRHSPFAPADRTWLRRQAERDLARLRTRIAGLLRTSTSLA
jgi:CHAD domain-containing protein